MEKIEHLNGTQLLIIRSIPEIFISLFPVMNSLSADTLTNLGSVINIFVIQPKL